MKLTTFKHKIEISPGRYIEIETEIPIVLTALIFTAAILSFYNFYRR